MKAYAPLAPKESASPARSLQRFWLRNSMHTRATCRFSRSVMHNFFRILVAGNFTKWVIAPCAIICAFAPKSVDAQAAPQAEVNPAFVRVPMARFHVITPDITIAETSPFTWDSESPSAKRHILLGAGVGAAAGAVLGVILIAQGEVGYLSPRLLVGIPLLVGAGTGALVGYLVYLSKR